MISGLSFFVKTNYLPSNSVIWVFYPKVLSWNLFCIPPKAIQYHWCVYIYCWPLIDLFYCDMNPIMSAYVHMRNLLSKFTTVIYCCGLLQWCVVLTLIFGNLYSTNISLFLSLSLSLSLIIFIGRWCFPSKVLSYDLFHSKFLMRSLLPSP